MPRLLPTKRNELVRRLRYLGWEGPFSGGKHQFMVKGATKLPIPNPHGGDISVGKLKEILNEIGVSREEWLAAG
jgi:predicted RNA binding protein YcfA (HicA-like mRNA interferase family)